MGMLSKVKNGFVNLLALRIDKWIDYQNLKGTTSYFITFAKSLYSIEKPKRTETFEQALERLDLTAEDLELQSKNFSFLTYFFLALAFFIFCYFLWLVLYGNIMGSCMSFAIFLYSLSLAFRYHFWNYQIQRRKLGCTLTEWLNDLSKKKT